MKEETTFKLQSLDSKLDRVLEAFDENVGDRFCWARTDSLTQFILSIDG